MGFLSGLLGGGGGDGGVGNSKSQNISTTNNVTENLTQGVQDGGTAINAGKNSTVTFTDAGAIDSSFNFANNNQAFANENYASTLGFASQQNKNYYTAFNELSKSNNSLAEKALEASNKSQSETLSGFKTAVNRISSIAQSQTGDVKPLVTSALIGLSVIIGLVYVAPKLLK